MSERTAAENAARGQVPPFCDLHWSWLCGYGKGQCAAPEPRSDPGATGAATVTTARCSVCGPLTATGRRSLDSEAAEHLKAHPTHCTTVTTEPKEGA